MIGSDVGVILAADETSDRVIDVAARIAASRGGQLRLMRYIDDAGSHGAHELGLRSAAAREQLADLRAQCRASDPHLVVTDRLHIGSLESLLDRLEPSIGSLVIGPDEDAARQELLDGCGVPVTVVD